MFGVDFELFAAFGREMNAVLAFEANPVLALAKENFFGRVSLFIGQNENGRPDRVDLKRRIKIYFTKGNL